MILRIPLRFQRAHEGGGEYCRFWSRGYQCRGYRDGDIYTARLVETKDIHSVHPVLRMTHNLLAPTLMALDFISLDHEPSVKHVRKRGNNSSSTLIQAGLSLLTPDGRDADAEAPVGASVPMFRATELLRITMLTIICLIIYPASYIPTLVAKDRVNEQRPILRH